MSSYPPPPPPVPDLRTQRRMWAAQARLAKDQQRAERARLRMQRRGWRRRSVAGPIILLALGVIFLLIQTGHLAWGDALDWYQRWWPTVLIAAGLVMLAEWAFDRSRTDTYPQTGRRLGGGVALLLICLLGFGLLARGAVSGVFPQDSALHDGWHNLARLAGERRSSNSSLSSTLPAGASLTIRNPHGDVTISGTSPDDQVHVDVETQVYAWSDRDADRIERDVRPQFSQQGSAMVLTSGHGDGGRTDLVVQTPHNVSVNVESGNGDTALNAVNGQIAIYSSHGDVTLNDITGAVSARIHEDSASVTAHDIHGPVTIEGRVGDVSLSDVHGAVLLQGDFFGETSLERISGTARFESSRTQFQCSRIDDQLEINGGPEFQGTALIGPVILKTSNRNITLDRVQGLVQVQNRNGSVSVTSAAPLAPIDIRDEHGTIDVGVSEHASFTVDAQTRNGDIENDFSLPAAGEKEHRTLQGKVGSGDSTISLSTSDGDIVIRKSSLPPPAPPAVPTPPSPPANAKGHHKTAVKEETF